MRDCSGFWKIQSHLCIPDTLLRAPIPSLDDSIDLQKSAEAFILCVVSTLPATPDHLASLQTAQTQDEIISQVCKVGRPEKNLKAPVKKFWMARNKLSLYDDFILHGNGVVIPTTLKQEILYTKYMKASGYCKVPPACKRIIVVARDI